MKIEYQKPWFIKPKLNEDQSNVITQGSFTINISFKIKRDFIKDKKIGFIGVPGKNFGLSYDYNVDLFVFEFWTKENDGDKFNCFTYDFMNDDLLSKGVTLTLTYDKNEYKIYCNYKIIDTIVNSNQLIDAYINEPIYLGCHNIDSTNPTHRCITEMEIDHLSIYNDVIDLRNLKNYISNPQSLKDSYDFDTLYCYYNLKDKNDDFLLMDELKDKTFLKKKNKMSDVGFELMKDKLNSVGCGFCLAKWTQVTMHLHNGTTHSCHHPEPHKIGLEEIKRNPTALHNSKTKKQARKEMLEGSRPSECQYCWNVEDNTTSFSDRIFKSSEPWSEPYFNEISNSSWRDDFNPKYVEVSFSNTCNFKCAYCGPEYSSKWMEEINTYGPYRLSYEYNGTKRMEERDTKPYRYSDDNPYVNAFWEWFPDLYNSLDTFRITGGEPLLAKDTWKVLDYIIESENPNTNLKLSINSNLGVTDDLIDKLIEKLEIITNEKRVKEIIIFTSCEGDGKQAEYARFGLDFNKLFVNIDRILTSLPKVTIVIMATFNVFSIFSYENLIKRVLKSKIKHFNNERYWNSALILDTSYLRHPPFLSFRILKDYINVEYFNRCIKFMKFNTTFRSLNFHKMQEITDVGFSLQEIEKITRIRDIFIADYETDSKLFDKDKLDFVKFIREYEIRRGYVCEEYFPELVKFIKKIEYENKI